MFSVPKRYLLEVLVIFVFLAVCVVVSGAYATKKQRTVERILVQEIVATHDRMRETSVLTESNGIDEAAAFILKECALQDAYEQAVGRLPSSTRVELERTKSLFYACGDHFALRKRFMVEKLREHVSDFSTYISWYGNLSGKNDYQELISLWRDMTALEQERADLLSEQVALQGSIIEGFLERKTVTQELRRAEEVQQFLEVKYQQVQELKTREAEVWARSSVVGEAS